jgi:hypothetical protein
VKTLRRRSAHLARPGNGLRAEELETREQPAGLGLSVLFSSGLDHPGQGLALGHSKHGVSMKVIETPAVRVQLATFTLIDLRGADTPQGVILIPADLLRVVELRTPVRPAITILDPGRVTDGPTTPPITETPAVTTPELPEPGGPSVDQPVASLFVPTRAAQSVSAVAAAVAPAATEAAASAATPSARAPSPPEMAAVGAPAATAAPTTSFAAGVLLFSQNAATPTPAAQNPTPTSLTVLASDLGPVAARSGELSQSRERFGLVYGLDHDLVPTSARPAPAEERALSTVEPPRLLIQVAPQPHVPDTEAAVAPPPAVVEAGAAPEAAVPVAAPTAPTAEENAEQSGWHWAWLAAVGVVIAGGGQWVARKSRFVQRAFAALRGPVPMPLLPADVPQLPVPQPTTASLSLGDWDE